MLRCIAILLFVFHSLAGCAQHAYTFYNNANSSLPDNTVRALSLAPDSAIWIGTDNGLCRLKNGAWSVYNTTNSGLPDNSIRSISFDADGNWWIGTFLGGVAVKHDTGWTVYNTANSGLPENQVRAIAFDTSGNPWMGTVGGLATLQNGAWTVYTTANTPFWVNNISSIYIDSNNVKWVGTTNGGLAVLRDTAWTVYRLATSDIPDNTIMAMEPDSAGVLWCAFPAVGAGAHDGFTWYNFNIINSNIASNSLTDISIGKQAKWFSSLNKGLIRYNGGTNWQHYSSLTNPDTSGEFLPDDHLLSVLAAPDGSVWAGTNSQGLVQFKDVVINDTTGITDVVAYGIEVSLYPNPATEYTVLNYGGLQAPDRVHLVATDGRVIEVPVAVKHGPKMEIPLAGLPRGIFTVLISSGEKVFSRRLVKL